MEIKQPWLFKQKKSILYAKKFGNQLPCFHCLYLLHCCIRSPRSPPQLLLHPLLLLCSCFAPALIVLLPSSCPVPASALLQHFPAPALHLPQSCYSLLLLSPLPGLIAFIIISTAKAAFYCTMSLFIDLITLLKRWFCLTGWCHHSDKLASGYHSPSCDSSNPAEYQAGSLWNERVAWQESAPSQIRVSIATAVDQGVFCMENRISGVVFGLRKLDVKSGWYDGKIS